MVAVAFAADCSNSSVGLPSSDVSRALIADISDSRFTSFASRFIFKFSFLFSFFLIFLFVSFSFFFFFLNIYNKISFNNVRLT
jgi:hypothetical protein